MADIASKNRGAKRDIITISEDESTSEQPVAKSAKKEAEEEVVELKEKLSKMEGMFQRSCRAAREAELRAERAENLLDSKQGILDGSKKTGTEKDERIDELTRRLEKYETPSLQPPVAPVVPVVSPPMNTLLVNEIAHTDPIFELIRPCTYDSISLDVAVSQLRAKFKECGQRQWEKYCKMVKLIENHSCEVCNKIFLPVVMFTHLFSDGHIAMIRSHRSDVSLNALNHWMHELQKAIDAAAAAREVITLDDDKPVVKSAKNEAEADLVALDNDEPAAKSTKREQEPVPAAPDEAKLQQKLAKAEKRIERLIKIAADAQSRVEFLESLIDNKSNISDAPIIVDYSRKVEELVKSVSSLENLLVKERMEDYEEQMKLRERIDELTSKLGKYGGVEESVEQIPRPLPMPQPLMQQLLSPPPFLKLQQLEATQHNSLLREVACLRRTIDNSTSANESLQQRINSLMDERAADLARIEELTSKLAQFERQQFAEDLRASVKALENVTLHDDPHPSNLAQMCRPGTADTIPLDVALVQLSAKFDQCNKGKFYQVISASARCNYDCEACEKELNKFTMIKHFLSDEHIEKVRDHGGAVSLAAVQYWLHELQKIAARTAAWGSQPNLQPSAAPRWGRGRGAPQEGRY